MQGSYHLWTNCAGLDANGQHQYDGLLYILWGVDLYRLAMVTDPVPDNIYPLDKVLPLKPIQQVI